MSILSLKRQEISAGTGFGISILNEEINYGSSISVTIDRASNVTRSPKYRFGSFHDLRKASIALSELEGGLKESEQRRWRVLVASSHPIHCTCASNNWTPELSINFVYGMYGPILGHEVATVITGQLAGIRRLRRRYKYLLLWKSFYFLLSHFKQVGRW
ncbi:MAG: hypothetical protein QXN59_02650 [Candidatus Micrarchaeaceae archaeon]